MAAPTLNSISPTAGPPGTEITCLGAGFDAGAQVGCPALVATTWVSAGELKATIPALLGEPGQPVNVVVYVRNADASLSVSKTFSVTFDLLETRLQAYTTVAAVAGEVPGFKRGGQIADMTIESWIKSVGQGINGAMLRRGLSLDPADWQQADADTAMPSPVGVLENLNRLGAAARLAAAVGGQAGTGEWGLAKSLREAHTQEMNLLRDGGYDKLFRPAAATIESAPQLAVGDMKDEDGNVEQAFQKGQVF